MSERLDGDAVIGVETRHPGGHQAHLVGVELRQSEKLGRSQAVAAFSVEH